jgi:hypothetical protein
MEVKDIIGLILILVAIPVCLVVNCVSQRARDAAFFLLVAGTVLTEKVDINFVSRYWYRGTTRGFEFTFLDVLAIGLLVSMLLLPRTGQRRWYWPAGLGAMILYVLYCCFSIAISEPKLYGLFELSKILRGILIFLTAALFVQSERELGILAFGLGCALCLEGAWAVKQHYLDGLYRSPGSLDHPNSLSVYLCTASPVFVAAATSDGLPRWLRRFCMVCIPVATVAILFTVSRAGIPIFALVMLGAAAFCVSWRITARKIIVTLVAGVGLAGFGLQSWDRLRDRFSQTTLEEEYTADHFEGRGYYLRQAKVIVDDRFFGVGLNNWSYWVCKKYGAQTGFQYEDYDDIEYAPSREILPSFMYAAPAHNLAALTVGELGWFGLIIFMLVWLRWFWMGASFLRERSSAARHRFGVGFFFATCGVFLQNLFEWVYRQTEILFMFHILLGALASLYYLKRQAKRKRAASGRARQAVVNEFQPAGVGSG